MLTERSGDIDVDGRSMFRSRVEVPMRDGILLATDIYAPDRSALQGARRYPVLLERTPYGIRADRFSDGVHANGENVTPESGAAFFLREGFLVVRQDCRGRGDSGGGFSKYVDEADDGFDTLSWLVEQPWCDGRVVTAGVSYSAHVQTAAASVGAPGIAAMILDSGGFASAYETGGRFGGAFELKQAIWAFRHALNGGAHRRDPGRTAYLEAQDIAAWFAAMPWQKGHSPLTGAREFEDYLFEQWAHEDLDEFWRRPGLYGRAYYDHFPDAPVLNISSWYDPYVRTAIDNFTALQRRKTAPSFLVLGPWTHGARSHSYAGDVDFGRHATLDGNLDSDYLSFKGNWLRVALGDAPPTRPLVSYFVMGGGSGRRNADGRMCHGGHWRTDDVWPPADARPVRWYLADEQRLVAERPARPSSLSYDFDPRDPVPTLGGAITSGEPVVRGGAFDQTPSAATFGARDRLPLSSRRDVVSFQTEPLTEDLTIAGSVVVSLRLSSSAPDTDITVKLVDVYPPNEDYPAGFAMNVTDGMLRCRYREGFDQPRLMEPGTVYPLVIPMPDTANVFAAGHRVRLDVSSSNFPRCDVNPNTGNRVMSDRTWQIARNTIHLGESFLELDVLPATGTTAVRD